VAEESFCVGIGDPPKFDGVVRRGGGEGPDEWR